MGDEEHLKELRDRLHEGVVKKEHEFSERQRRAMRRNMIFLLIFAFLLLGFVFIKWFTPAGK
jgi:hypothetical protein